MQCSSRRVPAATRSQAGSLQHGWPVAAAHRSPGAGQARFAAAPVHQVHTWCSSAGRRHLATAPRAQQDNGGGVGPGSSRGGGGSGRSARSLLSNLEVAVPSEQRPSNELQELKSAQLYSWATLPLSSYVQRLVLVFVGFFALIGGPVAYQTFDPYDQPVEWALSAAVGSLVVVTLLGVRIYLGWSYVQERLMSAAVEYEETGWYDGEVFVKPPEVLTRDRLLGMYEVKPIMGKLRSTLVGSGVALLSSAVVLATLIQAGADADGVYGRGAARGPSPRVVADGIIFSSKVQDLSQLAEDDELAAAEAEAAGGMPGYCRDRLLRAAHGASGICAKFDP